MSTERRQRSTGGMFPDHAMLRHGGRRPWFVPSHWQGAVLLVLMLLAFAPSLAAQSQTVQYSYDSLDRLVEARYPDRIVHYTYDPAGNRLTLSIERVNLAPTLTAVIPSKALAGGADVSITVNGTGFVDTSTANWNGVARPTVFLSDTQLSVLVSAADIATSSTAAITVTNLPPGGGTSTFLPFEVVSTCTFTVSPSSHAVAAAGGTGSLSVDAPAGDCPWTAVADQPWLTITSNASGAGPGSVSYAVGQNPSGQARSGHIGVGGETLTVEQVGAACTISVVLAPSSFTSPGGSGLATVTAAPQDCAWTALASDTWIIFTDPASGTGNGVVGFDVAPNSSTSARNGSVTVGGQVALIAQDGAPVILTIATAGTGSGTVTSAPAGIDCGTQCVAAFVVGQQVTLTAAPAQDSVFEQWTGDPDCTDGVVTLAADVQCTATFRAVTVGNPVPFISSLSPLAATPGSPGFTLVVNGANFQPDSVVRWNGVDHAPTFVSATRIETQIASSEVAAAATAVVTIATGPPGGGVSNQALVHVATATPDLVFLSSTDGTGAQPVAVAAIDLNSDGQPDMVVANMAASTVSVFLGYGDGTFAPKADFTTGSGPTAVLAADLNYDGRYDLVTTNYPSDTASVLLGNGDGTFGVQSEFGTGSGPFAIATGDFNADGALDLIGANSGSDSISMLLGNGDGTFRPRVDYPTASTPQGVVVGDFNGDGKLDILTADNGASSLSLFPGIGDGTLGSRSVITAGSGPRGLAAGDFNADGVLDLAVANELSNTVSILLGNGAGTFGVKSDITVGNNPRSVILGDVNADAKLDVVVSNSGSNSVSVLLGIGNGTFAPRLDVAAGLNPVSIARADFDRDGRLDLAIADQSANAVSILVGRLPAAVSINPSTVDFGQRAVGVPTSSRTVTITNGSASSLAIVNVVLASGALLQFETLSDGCTGASISSGGTCSVEVRYLAATIGPATADLRVSSNAPGSPHVVTLSGEAVHGSTISGFAPSSGIPGTNVTINGTKLTGATAVQFNGLAATFSVNSSTTITAAVPAGATSGPIKVTTPLNTVTSATAFLVAPRISGFLPGSGAVGVAVTLSGANFMGTTAVTFNGTPAVFAVNSPTQITASVPANATTGPTAVTTPAGTATSGIAFTVAPRIAGFSATSGPAGTSVTVTGANFSDASAVTFNGQASVFTLNSATHVTAKVPGTATTGPIALTTPAGTAVSHAKFTVTLPPAISGFSPTYGGPGASVMIAGVNFTGAQFVKFNGTTASYTVNSSTQITATVPARATTGPISVTTSVGTATSAGPFTIAPSISSFTPSTGHTGTIVMIHGASLAGTETVAFNGAAASFTIVSASTITATVPANASTGNITVTTPGGVATSSGPFAVQPGISGFSPTSGGVGGSVLITGTAFEGSTAVKFNGITASYTVNSAAQVTATVPANATSGYISLTTPAGTSTSSTSFTVAPRVTGFTPTHGAGGTSVTITGANFTGATSVKFNGTAATFVVNSSTRMSAVVPTGATSGPLSVTTPAGASTSIASFSQ